jgi:acetyl-CoA carboxylase biotin carboxyl carrier protein
MTVDEIRELIQLAVDTGITELEVQRGENRVRIRRGLPSGQDILVSAASLTAPAALPALSMQMAPAAGTAAREPRETAPESNQALVKSPIVGTFYEGPSPGAPPFVRVGERIQPGKVLCIIESMKLMNEIEAEVEGILESKLVQNGQPVEYGEALFAIRPL